MIAYNKIKDHDTCFHRAAVRAVCRKRRIGYSRRYDWTEGKAGESFLIDRRDPYEYHDREETAWEDWDFLISD